MERKAGLARASEMDESGHRDEDLWVSHLPNLPANSEENLGESCERV